MSLIRLFALMSALSATPVWAQFMRAEGTFTSPGVEATVILLDRSKGIAAASVSVVSGACSGSVSGVGEIRKSVLTFKPYEQIPGGEQCRVEVTFTDRSWDKVSVVGHECAVFSGAACGFEGQEARRRKGR